SCATSHLPRVELHCSRLLSSFPSGTASTDIYTFSLHDALPISFLTLGLLLGFVAWRLWKRDAGTPSPGTGAAPGKPGDPKLPGRSEEHTSELQSRENLVCRLLLEKKKKLQTGRWWTSSATLYYT